MTSWDGNLKITGNRILKIVPVNFWNPDSLPKLSKHTQIQWDSITTGGICGLILTLEKEKKGRIAVDTVQKSVQCSIDSLRETPHVWKCGGVEKRIEMYRIPDARKDMEYSFSIPLKNLNKGDNPVYIRVVQEDGHLAWTSPLYIKKI
jgi:hypothetical protein